MEGVQMLKIGEELYQKLQGNVYVKILLLYAHVKSFQLNEKVIIGLFQWNYSNLMNKTSKVISVRIPLLKIKWGLMLQDEKCFL